MAKRAVITKERRQLIEGLVAVGGKMVANGNGLITPEEVKSTLKLTSAHPTQLLSRAEKDGIIKRKVNGRRTQSISLVRSNHMVKEVTSGVAPSEPQQKKTRSAKPRQRKITVEMPDIGTTLTVSMISLDTDGRVQLGVRNETGSWIMSLDSYEPIG